jgi:TolB-like protein/Flp pilus assembly protein TadD
MSRLAPVARRSGFDGLIQAFLREFRRRNVPRAILLYVTSVWALAQGIAQLQPVVGAPNWAARAFLIAAAIGFPFWIVFSWRYELTLQGIRKESDIPADGATTRATNRRLDFWIIGALSLAVVLLLTDRLMQHSGSSAEPPSIAGQSVAVLPLVNESQDPNALYFSDGLSEAFIDALSQFPGLKVIARGSSFQFRNAKEPVRAIGEKLGVAHLLEGSVQRAGDDVRISAELINVDDATVLWSQHYDRPYKDLFKLQDDITQAVAAALKTKLLGGAVTQQSDKPPTGNLDSYNAFLEGIFHAHQGTSDDQRQAAQAFARAVQIDPNYAAAWAQLSFAEYDAADGDNAAVAAALAQSRADAQKAIALAPNLASAQAALGVVLLHESNWSGAEAELRQAAQTDPTKVGVKINLAIALATQGKTAEAVTLMHQALRLDPLRGYSYFVLGGFLMPLGRLDEAEAAVRKAVALQPESWGFYWNVVQIDVLRGYAQAALLDAQKIPAGQVWHDIAVALALQIGQDRGAADAALKTLIARHSGDSAYQIAEIYALRKDANAMFQWLERARAADDPGLQSLLYDPFILTYRHDPRFTALCEKLKLPVPKS